MAGAPCFPTALSGSSPGCCQTPAPPPWIRPPSWSPPSPGPRRRDPAWKERAWSSEEGAWSGAGCSQGVEWIRDGAKFHLKIYKKSRKNWIYWPFLQPSILLCLNVSIKICPQFNVNIGCTIFVWYNGVFRLVDKMINKFVSELPIIHYTTKKKSTLRLSSDFILFIRGMSWIRPF